MALGRRWDVGRILAKSIGSMTFSITVRVGSNWKNWNTNPMHRPRHSASADSDSEVMVLPPTIISPLVGRSMPAIRFSRVVLPLPDRPTIATKSPYAISRLRRSSALNSPEARA